MAKPGYTFIELVIVMGVTVLAVTAGIAAFGKFQHKQQAEARAQAMVQELRVVQKRASSGDMSECGTGESLIDFKVSVSAETDSWGIAADCSGGLEPIESRAWAGVDWIDSGMVIFAGDGQISGGNDLDLWIERISYCFKTTSDGNILMTKGSCSG